MRNRISVKMIRNLIFFGLLIFLTFWFIFRKQNMKELFDTIRSANILYLFIAATIMLLYHLTEAYNLRCLLTSFGEKKISILKALKFTFIGFFFSSITPAATGGQPVEIYYMSKEDISAPKSTMALLVVLFGFQLSTVSIGLLCGIFNPKLLSDGLIYLFLIGLCINIFALSFLSLCIFSHNITKRMINICVRVLKKLKVKNITKACEVLEGNIHKYAEVSIYIKSHIGEFIKGVLREFLQIILYYSVPYFIYRALGYNSCNFFELFSMQAVLYMSVSGLPLPGAVGISEIVFLKIFRGAFSASTIGASMLLSRGVTFYLYVIIALIVVIVNAIRMKDTKGEIDYQVKEIEKNDILFDNTLVNA